MISLKIHKNDTFLALILNFLLFHCLNIKVLKKENFDWVNYGGGTIIPDSLNTKANNKICQARPKFFVGPFNHLPTYSKFC